MFFLHCWQIHNFKEKKQFRFTKICSRLPNYTLEIKTLDMIIDFLFNYFIQSLPHGVACCCCFHLDLHESLTFSVYIRFRYYLLCFLLKQQMNALELSRWNERFYQHNREFSVESINCKQKHKLSSHNIHCGKWMLGDFPVETTAWFTRKENDSKVKEEEEIHKTVSKLLLCYVVD